MNQSREAHLPAGPLHSPEGHHQGKRRSRPARGYAGGPRRDQRRDPRREQRRVNRLGHGGTGPGPPGLRSLPAKQHAPKARPHPRHRPWPARRGSRAGRQGRMAAPRNLRGGGGAGHSPLTAGQLAPPAPPLPGRAGWPASRGETSHPGNCQPGTGAVLCVAGRCADQAHQTAGLGGEDFGEPSWRPPGHEGWRVRDGARRDRQMPCTAQRIPRAISTSPMLKTLLSGQAAGM
jgi:hypothetical protein